MSRLQPVPGDGYGKVFLWVALSPLWVFVGASLPPLLAFPALAACTWYGCYLVCRMHWVRAKYWSERNRF
jgi:hypothetical protein